MPYFAQISKQNEHKFSYVENNIFFMKQKSIQLFIILRILGYSLNRGGLFMGKSLTDIFQIWLETFKIEEETDNMKSKKKKESSAKSLHLPNAKENYRQTAKYQLQDYMRKVDISKKKGKEYCDLISSEPYPMRQCRSTKYC